jgi:hypothetical protein
VTLVCGGQLIADEISTIFSQLLAINTNGLIIRLPLIALSTPYKRERDTKSRRTEGLELPAFKPSFSESMNGYSVSVLAKEPSQVH